MGFWEYVIYDIFRSAGKEAEKEREAKATRQSAQFSLYGDTIGSLGEIITNTAQAANPNYFSAKLGEGGLLLPVYNMVTILRVQRGPATAEQKKLIEALMKTRSDFTQYDLLAAVSNQSHKLSKLLHEQVEISESHLGEFWKEFFKVIYASKCDDAVLDRFINEYSVLISTFGEMGNLTMTEISMLQRQFSGAVESQVIAYRSFAEEDIDFVGVSSVIDHKNRIIASANTIAQAKGDPDLREFVELIDLLFLAYAFELIVRSNRNEADKVAMIDYAIQQCNIKTEYDGDQLFSMKRSGELDETVIPGIAHSLQGILFAVAHEVGIPDEGTRCLTEGFSFCIGLEKLLSEKFPYSGFGDVAKSCFSDMIEQLMHPETTTKPKVSSFVDEPKKERIKVDHPVEVKQVCFKPPYIKEPPYFMPFGAQEAYEDAAQILMNEPNSLNGISKVIEALQAYIFSGGLWEYEDEYSHYLIFENKLDAARRVVNVVDGIRSNSFLRMEYLSILAQNYFVLGYWSEALQCYEEMLSLPGVLDVEYSAEYYTGELELAGKIVHNIALIHLCNGNLNRAEQIRSKYKYIYDLERQQVNRLAKRNPDLKEAFEHSWMELSDVFAHRCLYIDTALDFGYCTDNDGMLEAIYQDCLTSQKPYVINLSESRDIDEAPDGTFTLRDCDWVMAKVDRDGMA